MLGIVIEILPFLPRLFTILPVLLRRCSSLRILPLTISRKCFLSSSMRFVISHLFFQDLFPENVPVNALDIYLSLQTYNSVTLLTTAVAVSILYPHCSIRRNFNFRIASATSSLVILERRIMFIPCHLNRDEMYARGRHYGNNDRYVRFLLGIISMLFQL